MIAMAAADPSPAAVMTWARGLATLPATQTPGTLVRPLAPVTTQPSLVEVAAETDQQVVVRDEPRWHEQRVAGDDPPSSICTPRQLVVVDDERGDVAFDDADGAGRRAAARSARSECRRGRRGRGRRDHWRTIWA